MAIKEQKSGDPSKVKDLSRVKSLVSDMQHLLNDDKFADFVFIVEETELPVHKTILSGEEDILKHSNVSNDSLNSSHSGVR